MCRPSKYSYALIGLLVTAGVTGAPSSEAALLRPLIGGQSTVVVSPGDTLRVDLVMSTVTEERFDAALFRVSLSSSGLVLTDYSWTAPFSPMFDLSQPNLAELPLNISEDYLSGPNYPSGVADVEFGNLTDAGVFGQGTLLTLSLLVPSNWSGPDDVTLRAEPDLFTRGFDEIAVFSFDTLDIHILPSPGPLVGLALAWSTVCRRRRISP